jgi:hypothetical protein
VLKADNIKLTVVQEFGGFDILVYRIVVNLEAYLSRIVVGVTGVRHDNDTGVQIRAGYRDRLMKIMGEGGDSATARKMIADECNALEPAH